MPINFIQGFSALDKTWFTNNAKEIKLNTNEILIHEGEILKSIFFITNGLFVIGKETENFATVGPGSLLGEMSFLQEKPASASVTAVSNSIVLAVSYDVLKTQLDKDPNFASRFYRDLAALLSARLRELLTLFVIVPTSELDESHDQRLLGPVPSLLEQPPNFSAIKEIIDALPPLSEMMVDLKQKNLNFKNREKKLTVATVTFESIRLIHKIAKKHGVHDFSRRIIQHEPSFSADDKQRILPNLHIQKTVSLLLGDKYILLSGINFTLTNQLLKQVADILELPRTVLKNCFINPHTLIPEIELGLLRGMVSTFFSPGKITQLNLTAFIEFKADHRDVAVSMSPFESLLLPADKFLEIVREYAQCAYPYVPFAILSDEK